MGDYVKQRLTSLDVKAVVHELQSCVGLRLINLYDISPRLYMFKFGHGDKKIHVIFEVGARLHTTTFIREKPALPSQFTLRLRKYIRSWRLEQVSQLGVDRVVMMRFGSSEQGFTLFLELYGQGNFILTDAEFTIQMILRNAKNDDIRLAVKEKYPVQLAKAFVPQTKDKIRQALQSAPTDATLKQTIELHSFGALLAEKVFRLCSVSGSWRKEKWGDIEELSDRLFAATRAIDAFYQQPELQGGALIRSSKEENNLCEFWPACLSPYLESSRVSMTATFSEAVEKCFLATEQDKIEQHNTRKEAIVLTKKEKFFRDHQRRIDGLVGEIDKNRRLGELIEANVDEVDAAIQLIRGVLATGISWGVLSSVIRQRQAEGTHPVANIIHELKLQRNSITLLLCETPEEDEEEGDLVPQIVEVDIGMGAFANARSYYSQKKHASSKLEKTEAATDKAAAAAEAKGKRVACKTTSKVEITQMRTPMWFEKFAWFLTSRGHLVISGHDPMQSDIIMKRYSSPSDIFVHSDHPTSQPCVIKNADDRVPMASIEEAGIFCLSMTDSWKKSNISAWWVQVSAVSKGLTKGDNFAPGKFHIDGSKTYIPAMQLQLVCALVFRNLTARVASEDAGDMVTITAETPSREATSIDDVQNPSVPRRGLPSRSAPTPTPSVAEAKKESTTRSKKKMAKMREKYGEQDDEDRQLALTLLGSKAVAAERPERKPASEDVPSEKVHTDPFEDRPCVASEDVLRQRRIDAIEDARRIREKMESEMKTEVPFLDGAVSETPLYAMAVCAPLASVRHYSVKVKISPGSEKRGHASKSIIASFQQLASTLSPSVASVVSLLHPDALVPQLPAGIKVHSVEQAVSTVQQSSRQKAAVLRDIARKEKEDQLRAEKAELRAQKAAQRDP